MRSTRALAAAIGAALVLAGCSTGTAATTASAAGTTAAATSSSTSATGSSTATSFSSSSATTTVTTQDNAAIVVPAALSDATHFDSDDLVWDSSKEVAVTLADDASAAAEGVTVNGNTVTITAGGTYRLSGTLTDGQLVVAAGAEDVVRIILDGVQLSSSTGSPFVVTSANEAIVYLADGSTNAITDASSYADQGDDAANAALYSMADLTIAGSGSLTVTGNYDDGIVTKDGLVLAGGTVTVNAVDDGIRGKDYVALVDGSYSVTSGGDGIKSDNDQDADRGWLLISGGTVTVDSGDDAIKGYNSVSITAGTVTVTQSVEAIESQHIDISGGTIDVTSSDDGVNAAGGTGNSAGGMGGGEAAGDYTLTISGGVLTVNAQGDGLDSNGSATISAGTIVVNGPTDNGNGALDVNGDFLVNGGTLAAAGSSGMAVTPGTGSAQSGVQVTFASPVAAGTAITLADGSGAVVATFVTTKTTAMLVFSSPAIVAGQQYTAYSGGSADVSAGLGTGTLDGATQVATVTAGTYTAGRGPGGGGGFGGTRPTGR